MHSVQRREKNGSISIKPFAPYFNTNDSWIRKKFWIFPISTSFLTFLLDALSGPVCGMMDIFQAASPLLDRQKAIHKLWVLYKLGTGGIFRLSQLFDHIIILTLFNHWQPLDEEIILHFYVSMHSHHESVWIGSSQASTGSESWGGSQALSWTEWNLPHSQQL